MRTIKVGDQVQAFLSPEIVGEVVSTRYVGSNTHFVGGTAPTMTTTASAVDRVDYVVKSTDVIHAVVSLDVKATS